MDGEHARADVAEAGGRPSGAESRRYPWIVVSVLILVYFLAFGVAALREPRRGQADGIFASPEPHPFRQLFRELRAIVPPLTIAHLWIEGARGRTIAANVAAALLAVAAAWIASTTLGMPRGGKRHRFRLPAPSSEPRSFPSPGGRAFRAPAFRVSSGSAVR